MICNRISKWLQELLVIHIMILSLKADSNKNAKDHRLLLISMDGFRWDYLHGRARTPTFDFIKSKGVHATDGIISVYLTNTIPNHMSMVSGLFVENHGMIDNIMFDPETNDTYVAVFYDHDVVNDPAWLKTIGEPLWISHQIQNRGKTGLLMWMDGETAFGGVRATKFFKHTYTMDEVDEMNMLMDWLTDENEPIDLALVYFPQPDLDGHNFGPESAEVTRKIEYLDKALAHLLQQLESHGLSKTTDIIVTSDHGFTSTSPERAILLEDILDPTWYKTPTRLPATSLSIFPIEGKLDTVYDKLKAWADKTGLFHVYKSREIPKRFHYKSHRRVPPIFAQAVLGYSFYTRDTIKGFEELKGNHGYDNQHQEMRPIFMAYGPSFQEGVSVKTFKIVDIYPLVCHLKGIAPQPNNGSMEIVSKLLRHHPFDQSQACNKSTRDLHQSHYTDSKTSCKRQYKDDEVPDK